jgi:sugar phosphate isomerase/epimerase
MNLSVSNIIWEKGADKFESFLQTLLKNSIYSVELSLNSIFPEPKTITDKELSWLSSLLCDYNISISALHSLTYTRPDLEIFGTSEKKQELIDYILMYDEIASALKTKNLVFGSAQARKLHDHSKKEATQIFSDFLVQLDTRLKHSLFHIEPLPYNQCEYLHTFLEGVSLVDTIQQLQHISIQLDIKSILENGESLSQIFQHSHYIQHIHTSEPGFMEASERYAPFYEELRNHLSEINYSGYISAEVLNLHHANPKEYLSYTISQLRKYHE